MSELSEGPSGEQPVPLVCGITVIAVNGFQLNYLLYLCRCPAAVYVYYRTLNEICFM
jgi:hypothetical protein